MAAGGTKLVLPSSTSITEHMASPTVLVRTWVDRSHDVQAFRPNAHRGLELACVIEGRLHYRLGARELTAAAGSVIVVPAGVEHMTSLTPGTRALSLHMSTDLLGEVAQTLGPRYTRRQIDAGLAAAPERFMRLASLLAEEATDGGPGSALAADGLAEALAVHIVRGGPQRISRARENDPRILRALQLAEDVHGANLDVEDLARAAGMSRYHFSRRFSEVTGTSPYRYLLEVKLARAAELLRRGHLSVTEAALDAGFNDFGRFAAHFRRTFGCLPSNLASARSARKTARIA